jgi:hypothetical protein
MAHHALANAYLRVGDVAAAATSALACTKLAPAGHRFHHTASEHRGYVEILTKLEEKLPALVKSELKPQSEDEQLKLVDLCLFKKYPHAAARFFTEAPDGLKGKTDEVSRARVFRATCAALLAAAGEGHDAANLDAAERSRCRRQAFAWLQSDFDAWVRIIETGKPEQRQQARKALRIWQAHTDLATVRDLDALLKIPADERPFWRRFWRDVAGEVHVLDEQTRP